MVIVIVWTKLKQKQWCNSHKKFKIFTRHRRVQDYIRVRRHRLLKSSTAFAQACQEEVKPTRVHLTGLLHNIGQ